MTRERRRKGKNMFIQTDELCVCLVWNKKEKLIIGFCSSESNNTWYIVIRKKKRKKKITNILFLYLNKYYLISRVLWTSEWKEEE